MWFSVFFSSLLAQLPPFPPTFLFCSYRKVKKLLLVDLCMFNVKVICVPHSAEVPAWAGTSSLCSEGLSS